MEFKIGEDTEESAQRDSPNRAAPNYSSLGVRLRLMSLVAMLVLVLIAMEKASKPETWERLGFREPVVNSEVANSESTDSTNRVSAIHVSDRPHQESGEQGKSRDDEPSSSVSSMANPLIAEPNSHPAKATGDGDFWLQFYEMLSDKKKQDLLRVLRFARIQQPLLEEYLTSSTELITQLGPALESHLSQLDESTLESEKELLSKQRQSLATIAIGQQLEPAQRAMMLDVERRLQKQAFSNVRDRTPMKRAADGPAWIFAWEQILAGKAAPPISVSHLQLMSQPEFYRGKPVELKGTIRGAQRISTKGNELGIECYFVVWVQPDEAGTGPFCVYVFELPDDFPAVGDQFTKLELPAKIAGLFFKLRVYAARSGEVPTCPLLLAKSFHPAKPDAVVANSGWRAEPWFMIPFFLIALPLVAYLAYIVYQSSKTSLPNHGKVATEQIEKTFEELKQDPDIKSDMERIRDLHEN